MPRISAPLLLFAATLSLGDGVAAPQEDAARALSPGAVALLLNGELGPTELARVRAALGGARADARAVAARVARVRGVAGLVPALLDAIAVEADPDAAREQLAALGWLAADHADEPLFAAAKRFDGRLDEALVRSLAARGPAAFSLVPRLTGLEPTRGAWVSFFGWATRGGREGLEKALEAATAVGTPEAWAALLEVVAQTEQPLADQAVARAIQDSSARVREQTYWQLLRRPERERPIGPHTKAALAKAPEALAAGQGDALAMLAFELLGRSLGRPPVDRTALLRSLAPEDAARLPADWAVLVRLRGDEKAAFGEVRFGDKDWVKEHAKRAPRDDPDERRLLRDRRIRTASDLPPGVVADAFAVTGCSLTQEPGWAAIEASFDADGRLSRMGHLPLGGDASCQPAAQALLLMSLLPTDRPARPGETDVVLLPLSREFAACVDPPEGSSARPMSPARRPGGRVPEPRKLKNVSPSYPQAARTERREGVIVVDAIVGTRGCIRSAEVVSGRHLDLAGEALRSVMQWVYTPTLLEGQPVPVVMTVTVNFKLQ